MRIRSVEAVLEEFPLDAPVRDRRPGARHPRRERRRPHRDGRRDRRPRCRLPRRARHRRDGRELPRGALPLEPRVAPRPRRPLPSRALPRGRGRLPAHARGAGGRRHRAPRRSWRSASASRSPRCSAASTMPCRRRSRSASSRSRRRSRRPTSTSGGASACSRSRSGTRSRKTSSACARLRERVGTRRRPPRRRQHRLHARGDGGASSSAATGLDIEFVEQPVTRETFGGIRRLPRGVALPDRGRREPPRREGRAGPRRAASRACGIYNIKLMKCGGVWPALRIAAIAETAGIRSDVGLHGREPHLDRGRAARGLRVAGDPLPRSRRLARPRPRRGRREASRSKTASCARPTRRGWE